MFIFSLGDFSAEFIDPMESFTAGTKIRQANEVGIKRKSVGSGHRKSLATVSCVHTRSNQVLSLSNSIDRFASSQIVRPASNNTSAEINLGYSGMSMNVIVVVAEVSSVSLTGLMNIHFIGCD